MKKPRKGAVQRAIVDTKLFQRQNSVDNQTWNQFENIVYCLTYLSQVLEDNEFKIDHKGVMEIRSFEKVDKELRYRCLQGVRVGDTVIIRRAKPSRKGGRRG